MNKILNTKSIYSLEHSNYKNQKPFSHIVIDNFLNDDTIELIMKFSKSLKLENCDTNRLPPNKNTQYKYAYDNINSFPNEIKELFIFLNSKEFIAKIEKLTGITECVIGNHKLEGGGFHKITNKGFLNLHTDFNNYNDAIIGSLDRRINLLLYLNPEWKEEYKGHLWLCNKDEKKIEKKILPILNRCVIFSTTNNAIHGHPERLNVPKGITRDSIATYYYTKNTRKKVCFEGDKFHSTIYYKTKDFIAT
jgi:Rps23 Pro-64 3,4-dihydroxylase Tpa1-like proline 4-hydroxylase